MGHVSILHFFNWVQLQQPATSDDAELAVAFGKIRDKFQYTLKTLETFQAKNSERVFSTGWFSWLVI